ncbi:tetratricopeptide repeat protein 5-like [Oppia nitens]|uniref:tetratricopeptide repeat protein 5-like n=1 Tax=Oppia nitens TaxID=1686743 RepID=UPI0023DA98D0|nr:tetratricopeptide repeat protein 5-like [Oppia nitens]
MTDTSGQTSSSSPSSSLSSESHIKQLVDELYDFRDKYFVRNAVAADVTTAAGDRTAATVKSRHSAVNNKLAEVLQEFDKLCAEWPTLDRTAVYCLQRGRALNITDQYSDEAHQQLLRAVKLLPKSPEAWNQLGESYRKFGDTAAALNCFESAVKYGPNKVSLRNTSMILRQLNGTVAERDSNLTKSVDKAKQALDCDLQDGISWYVLGNAYLTLFFRAPTTRNSGLLKLCKAAYIKANEDEVAKCQSDYLYNYATVLHYEQEFAEALDCLQRATIVDPEWEQPAIKLLELSNYFHDICDMIAKKASLKARRLQTLIDQLVNKDTKHKLYANRKLVTIGQLTQPSIAGAAATGSAGDLLICKVMAGISNSSAVASTYCAIDSERQCCAIFMYNIAVPLGPKTGDTLVIAKPFCRDYDFEFGGKSYKFRAIRVDNPTHVLVNHKPISNDSIVLPHIENLLIND